MLKIDEVLYEFEIISILMDEFNSNKIGIILGIPSNFKFYNQKENLNTLSATP